jgi:outer membrane protein TolC
MSKLGYIRKLPALIILNGLALVIASFAGAETLEQAWQEALTANRGLKAFRENTAAAAGMAAAAKTSRLPTLDVNAGYQSLDNEQALDANILGQRVDVPLLEDNGFHYRVMATQPLYTGGRIESGINAGESLHEASREQEINAEQNLKMQVAEAYVAVLRTHRLLIQAESHVKSLEAHAYDVAGLYEQGMVVVSDQLAAQVALADARQQRLQISNAVQLAHSAFNRLLMRPLDQSVTLDEIELPLDLQPLEELTSRALGKRRELKVLSRQREATRYQAQGTRGEKRPQVALSGGYNYLENRYLVEEGQWLIMLGVQWRLFDGGGVKKRALAMEHQATALEEQRKELASIISLQVRQAWLDAGEAQKRIVVTEAAIASAEENVNVVRDRYTNGFCSHTEVLDAETQRVKSLTSAANARYDLLLAELQLQYALGEL